MVAIKEGRKCQTYPCCGYNPEFSPVCTKVRKAYGACSGPCSNPCYIVSSAHYTRACTYLESPDKDF